MNWYYSIEGRSQGPLTENSLRRLAREGTISAGTLVWHPGLEAWEPLEKLKPEIAEQVNKGAPAGQQGDDAGVMKRIFGWGKKK